MKKNLEATIINGKIIPLEPRIFFEHINKLEGKKVSLEIKKFRNKRTLSQNDYYWALMKELSDYTGYTQEEWHEFFKIRYLVKVVSHNGVELGFTAGSTTVLDTKEMSKLTDNIRDFSNKKVKLYLLTPEEYFNKHGQENPFISIK